MKDKKGFTLIELLAVIVILAVIALIATPLIMNTINDAKEGSAKNSASGYVKALEQTVGTQMVKDTTFKPDERQNIVGKVTGKSQKGMAIGDLTETSVSYDVQYKGTKPTSLDFILKNGIVTQGSKITISGYTFTMDQKGEWVKDGSSVTPPTGAKAFATDSWDTIAQAVKSGTHPYKVGDTKEVQVGSLGTFTVRVANTTTPAECSTSGYSQSACGFVVEFEDVVTRHVMNPKSTEYPTSTNVGGYPASAMKTYLSGEFLGMLPADLQKNIKTTTVVSSHGSEDANNFTSNEKVYLLAPKEIYGETFKSSDDSAKDTTHQLDYYKSKGVTTSSNSGANKKNASGSGAVWWLRSAYSDEHNFFYIVYSSGSWGGSTAYATSWVAPAFRIR